MPRRAAALATIAAIAGAVACEGGPELAGYDGTFDQPVVPFVPASSVGQPWGQVQGILQFRGNPTHTFHGTGVIPAQPEKQWRFPDEPMCGNSSVGGVSKLWCGTGWTGQPVIWERPDGITEAIFGAYDKRVHFVDVATGERTREDFVTDDIIKGSVTLDPDGYPLLYFGSRDNKLRVVALDRDKPTELWSLHANVVNGMWNNDWDGNPSIVGDVLFEGGENSYFFAVKLGRGYGDDGLVVVDPALLVAQKGWTDELLDKVGDRNASIENSVAVFEDRVYFANGHGRIVGLDTSSILDGEAPIVFDYWAGDDIDASIVVDAEGMLYVAIENERGLERADEVGQLIKLDPNREADPRVWGVPLPAASVGEDGGAWATPALGDGVVYVTSHAGTLYTVDSATGEVLDESGVGSHAWSSPVLVGDRLLVGTCIPGGLNVYSVADPRDPELIGQYRNPTGGCIESTPAVWKGQIVVGSRDGYVYSFR